MSLLFCMNKELVDRLIKLEVFELFSNTKTMVVVLGDRLMVERKVDTVETEELNSIGLVLLRPVLVNRCTK